MSKHALKEQLRRERNIRSKIYIILLLIVLFFLLYGFFFGNMGYLKYRELKNNEKKLLTEIERISQVNSSLSREIDLLKKDQAYLEKYAKEKFGLVKPGEMIFQFKSEEK